MKNLLLWGLLVIVTSLPLQAQIFGTPPVGEGRTWNIRFVIDPGLTTQYARYRDVYEGERYYPATDTTAARWEWASWDSIDYRVLDYYKAGNVRLGVLLNVWDNLYVGVNYTFYLVQGYRRVDPTTPFGSYVYWPFFSLSGSVNYDYALPFGDRRFSLQPTLSLGTYQSERSFEGVGQEMSYEGRLGFAYRFRATGQSQIRIWANYQHLTYRSSETSFIYPDRERYIASDWGFMTIGAGFVWHLDIQEDAEERPSRRLERQQRQEEKLRRKRERLERKLEESGGG